VNCFSFRAECLGDALIFVDKVSCLYKIQRIIFDPDPVFPDVDVVMGVSCTKMNLVRLARKIEDAHVIAESLVVCKH
jgi:hypothetical protein